MSLKNLVASRLESTDAEIVAELNALTVAKIDTQLWTWGGLNDRFEVAMVGAFADVLAAMPGTKAIIANLTNPGVNFSLEKTQNFLESLRAVPQLADHIDNLKSIGRWSISPYQDDGGTGEVTEEQVAEARAEIIADQARQRVDSWAATLWNEIVNPMVAAGNSEAEIKAAIAGVE